MMMQQACYVFQDTLVKKQIIKVKIDEDVQSTLILENVFASAM